eukprot:Sspe_Gene.66793::Locus_39464_Transcript_1_1_Confidence_1.000_Length_1432::g.66793::m.66793/K00557/trmA; tRNA (uracil-5-)-methyltransferase
MAYLPAEEDGEEMSWMNFDPSKYDDLFNSAVEKVVKDFAELRPDDSPLDLYPSPPLHFRLRVKFLVAGNEEEAHSGSDTDDDEPSDEDCVARGERPPMMHASWRERRRQVIEGAYPVASETICDAMPRVITALSRSPAIRKRLRGIQYLSTMSGELLVTLVYKKRRLGPTWVRAMERVREETGVDFIANSKGVVRHVGGRDSVVERLHVRPGVVLTYKQMAGSFSNPNGHMAIHTLNWLDLCAREMPRGDLLELYCGNGNHTVAMSRCYRRVLGIEINRKLVQAAHWNLSQNGCTNAWVLRAPSENFCSSMLRHRTWRLNMEKYRRESCTDTTDSTYQDFLRAQRDALSEDERSSGIAEFDFKAVIVDPPRAGLDPVTRELVVRYDHICYISCNPANLLRDLRELTRTHSIARMAVFDHFPYTGHLECGAFLRRRV